MAVESSNAAGTDHNPQKKMDPIEEEDPEDDTIKGDEMDKDEPKLMENDSKL